MTVLVPAVHLAAAALASLLAGFYLAFSLRIMPALAGLPDRMLVTVMQTVNRVIVRPGFALLFVGAPLAAVATSVLVPLGGAPVPLVVLAVAGAVLQVASIVLTVVVHLPRNDALDRAGPDDADGRRPGPRGLRASVDPCPPRAHRRHDGRRARPGDGPDVTALSARRPAWTGRRRRAARPPAPRPCRRRHRPACDGP